MASPREASQTHRDKDLERQTALSADIDTKSFSGELANRGPLWSETPPTVREEKILGRIASSALLVSYSGGRPHFRFEGYGPSIAGRPFDVDDFEKFLNLGWLEPDPWSPGLFRGVPAQRYRACRP
jgi:hypothetical protein